MVTLISRILIYRTLLHLKLVVVLCVFSSCHTTSPELIDNGSFELRTKCPGRISELRLALGWGSSGSPDLFCSCSNTSSPVYADQSFAGSMRPQSGECYAGFIVNSRYKEYPRFYLPKKMKKNSVYCIRFMYSRSPYSGVKVKRLGIFLHREPFPNSQRGKPLKIKTADTEIADRPGIWSVASFTFSCKGGERYISFGSFNEDLCAAQFQKPAGKQKVNRVFNYLSSAYYFLEDIRLTELKRGQTCETEPLLPDSAVFPVLTGEPLAIDTVKPSPVFVLKDLLFETNKSEILPASFNELNELADYLRMEPQLQLTITGHTDSIGSSLKNKILSEERARSVANYLVRMGTESERLSSYGFGDTRPVASNSSAQGREKNRRVEFQFR